VTRQKKMLNRARTRWWRR